MIDKSNEYSPKSNVSKPIEENPIEAPNFNLLYRNMPDSERDKSSGASSDEETTSSSLIPIPETLRRMRNKLKRTVSDAERSESAYNVSEILEKPAEILKNSLEELRRKYTLKNETSVALKMNSANLMLDDILNSANLNPNDNLQSRFYKQEVKSKTLSENETSTTESSVSIAKHFPQIIDPSHPIAYDFFTPPCPRHGSFPEPLNNSLEKGTFTPPKNVYPPKEIPQRKKTLMEKMQDLQIKCKIQSVYRSLQRTRNPFMKSRKEPEDSKLQQGIPGVGCHENHTSMCKCENCHTKHQPKRVNLDLVESSELSQSEFKGSEWEGRHCTCFSQRECDCPEVIPKCNCVAMSTENTSKPPKHSSPLSDVPNNENDNVKEIQSNTSASQKKESESSLLLPKENEDNLDKKKKKINALSRQFQGSKYCSQEKRIIERTDVYYFDHGNSAYYQTTDNHPIRYTECLVERTDHYATKFWAEIFGTIEIGVAFLISFLLQFYRFLFTSIIRSLTVGLLQISSDYFIKPFLTIIFNGLIQPCLILAYNIATSVRDLCLPISQIFGFFAKEVALVLRSCRLVEVNREKQASCYCGNKV